ncbi:MAG: ROK family protein [Acidimicrobiales bacterium]
MTRIGVDVGGTKVLGVGLDDDGSIVSEHRIPTPSGGRAVIDAIVEVANLVSSEVGAVSGVGCGVPGLVDADGVLRFAPNLPGVIDLAVRRGVADATGFPVRVENDATAAAWGEAQCGAGRGRSTVLLVTLGTGIGGGIVLDGRLYRGAHGFAGEIGHMVVDPHGPPCPCGKRGCWERFASGSGLGRIARDEVNGGRAPRIEALAGGDRENVRGEHVTEAAREGDGDAKRILADFGWWVALGLAGLANAFDPEAFVMGGGLIEAGDLLLDPVRASFVELVEGNDHRPEVPILAAALGERAGAIGAGLLAPGSS